MTGLEITGTVLICIGSFMAVAAAIGILRFPDIFTRLHPAGVSDSLGVMVLLLGVMCFLPFGLLWIKVIVLIIFALITSSTACHALSKSAYYELEENNE